MTNICVRVNGKFMCTAATSSQYCKFYEYPESNSIWWCKYANKFEDQTCSCVEAQIDAALEEL